MAKSAKKNSNLKNRKNILKPKKKSTKKIKSKK